jgi:predicted N-acetyltransferase YhbS
MQTARDAGEALVVLVGDEPYYGRLGFQRIPRGQITMPGPVDPDRLLAAGLVGQVDAFSGMITRDLGATRRPV